MHSHCALALELHGSAPHTSAPGQHWSRAPGEAVSELHTALASPWQDQGWGSQTDSPVLQEALRTGPLPCEVSTLTRHNFGVTRAMCLLGQTARLNLGAQVPPGGSVSPCRQERSHPDH